MSVLSLLNQPALPDVDRGWADVYRKEAPVHCHLLDKILPGRARVRSRVNSSEGAFTFNFF